MGILSNALIGIASRPNAAQKQQKIHAHALLTRAALLPLRRIIARARRRFVCRRAGFGVSLRAFADVAHLDRVQPSEG